MRRIVILIGILLCFNFSSFTNETLARGHRSYTSHHTYTSHCTSYHSGYYAGGKGSSHKGGHYKNSSTHDHFRTRR
jgi:hypothetical protein